MVKIGRINLNVLWLKVAYKSRIKNIEKEYEELLKIANETGTTVCNASQMAKFISAKKMPNKCLALTHDVDRESGKRIQKILSIERKYNDTSTFFVRLHRYSLEPFKKMARHWEIGLHGEFKGNNRIGQAMEQKKSLEKMIGRKAVGVSMHKGHWEGNKTINAAEKAGFFYIISYVERKGKIITLPYEVSDIAPVKNLKYLNNLLKQHPPKKLDLVINTHADYFY